MNKCFFQDSDSLALKVVTIMEKTMFARYLHTRFNYQEKAFYCLKRCFLGGLRINSTVYAFLYFNFFLNSYFFDHVFPLR